MPTTTKAPETPAKYIVVERSEVPARRDAIGRPIGEMTQALIDGKIIFIPRVGDVSFRKTLSKYGRRLRTRVADREGVRGTYLWAEEIE